LQHSTKLDAQTNEFVVNLQTFSSHEVTILRKFFLNITFPTERQIVMHAGF